MEEKVRKPKGKPRGGNSPVIGMNGYTLEPGDNSKFIEINMALMNLPDIDLHDEQAVVKRLSEFFTIYAMRDTKPTVSGMAMALNGMSRTTLRAIANDLPTGGCGYKTALPQNVANVIKKAYSSLEILWENYMQNGKVNPVTGIFLGKNNFGYQDKVEHVITPNTKPESDYSTQDILDRYALPEVED